MKILLLITRGNVGGAQMSVLNLARGLKKRGAAVTVGFGAGNFLRQELADSHIPFVNFKYLRRSHNPLVNLLFIHELKKYLNRHRFDIVHINSSNALAGALAARLSTARPRIVFTHRGLTLLDPNYKKNKILKILYRLFFKFFLCFVDEQAFVSRQNGDYARKHKIARHGRIIYNGLNPDKLHFDSADTAKERLQARLNNPKFKIQNSKFLLGSIGRLDYAKNYEFLINIFPEILKIKKDAYCIIIGEGGERKKYKNLIAKLNLKKKIILAGEIKNARQYLPAFDLFVLPSRYEGLSITLIEALFAGRPVLASAVGGNPEALGYSPAQLYPLNNKKEFLAKFKNIINSEEKRRQLGKSNQMLAAKFHINRTVEKYWKTYLEFSNR